MGQSESVSTSSNRLIVFKTSLRKNFDEEVLNDALLELPTLGDVLKKGAE